MTTTVYNRTIYNLRICRGDNHIQANAADLLRARTPTPRQRCRTKEQGQRTKDKSLPAAYADEDTHNTANISDLLRTRTHTTRQTYRTYCGRGRPHPDSIGGCFRQCTHRLYKALSDVSDAIGQVLITPLPGIVKHFRRGTLRLYRALRNIIGHYCLLL